MRSIWNDELKKANVIIKKRNEEIKKFLANKVQLLDIEIAEQRLNLSKSKRLLSSFYDKGLIFPKYQHFTAISMFLEYLLSGRCENLASCYNKYEEELRQNLIIEKLDIIIEQLESIKRNQYMLYQAINSVNDDVKRLTGAVNSTINALGQINSNAEVIAYNSEVLSRNEQFQTFLLWVNTLNR